MEKIREFWNNKSNAERRKIIVYAIAGVVCVGLFALVIAFNSTSTEKEVSDFSNPDAKEVAKYNSRTEANNLGKKDSADLNLAMDDLFGESQETAPVYQEPTTYYEPNYSSSPNTEYQQPAYSSPQSSSGGGSYNKHSTYGDYSMWQSEEPKNNSVGYTNKNVPKTTKENRKSSEPEYTEIPTPTYQEPSYSNSIASTTQSLSQGKQIRAKLLSQGYASNGRSLSFVLLESTKIAGETTPKGLVITGIAREENNRLMVNFSTIKVKNKIVPVQMTLFGSDGMAGLPIGGGSNGSDIGSEATNRGKDVIAEQANRIPVIGGIIGGAVRNNGSRTADNKIKLSTNIECIIVNYN
ncbi:conjugative transposon protein TraM [Chryseobacterium taklimakanense]|uniref:Conjugative transposon protein TraM n=1 Tax=Chryseobacterium taklimakanense TaxID=536441 RepID=A0A3G8WPS1_9FLAO|nr:conjugative transposon protein TraM [Chryseobacterium taklimakanense]AZI21497.1 conjugative transposon protein TraM [Chryseobacterium taklimakanense]